LNWFNKGIHDICFFITYIIPPPRGLFLPEGKSFLDFALLGKKKQLTKAGQPFLLELVLIFRD